MRKSRLTWIAIATAALTACQREPVIPAAAPAASARASAPRVAPSAPDPGAGRSIALQGVPGAAACASCHGANGEGNPQAGVPRLAGLARPYVERQLNSYADGTRANPVMTPVAGALSAQQREAVAAFYAGLAVPAAGANAVAIPAPALVTSGDTSRGIPACANCHGAQGTGDAAANPSLAGQNENYFVATLAAWKDGSRHNDATGAMPTIAKALTEDEVRQLASYYANLPPQPQKGSK